MCAIEPIAHTYAHINRKPDPNRNSYGNSDRNCNSKSNSYHHFNSNGNTKRELDGSNHSYAQDTPNGAVATHSAASPDAGTTSTLTSSHSLAAGYVASSHYTGAASTFTSCYSLAAPKSLRSDW